MLGHGRELRGVTTQVRWLAGRPGVAAIHHRRNVRLSQAGEDGGSRPGWAATSTSGQDAGANPSANPQRAGQAAARAHGARA